MIKHFGYSVTCTFLKILTFKQTKKKSSLKITDHKKKIGLGKATQTLNN